MCASARWRCWAQDTAHAVDGTWTGPGGEWTTGTNWSSSPTVPDNTASFTNNGAPTSVTISNNAAINTIEFAAAAPAYSFTVQNGATFTVNSTSNSSSFMPDFSVSSGATLAVGNGGTVEIGSLAGGGALQLGTSDPNTLLFIAGSTSTTYSGVISGPGSIELDDAASLRLTGTGSVIGGDLDLCLCSTGSLTIDGGSLTVNGFAQGVAVEGGTLSVINGGTLQVGPTSGFFGDLLVASNMVISGPGSTVTVSAGGFTGIGLFGPGALTISNGGVLSSQGGAEVDSFFGGPATVVVTGAGSQWNIGGLGLSVGGGTTGGTGTLTISGGGVVTTNVAFIGDSDRRLVLRAGDRHRLAPECNGRAFHRRRRLRLRSPGRNAHHRGRRRGRGGGHQDSRRQHAQARHRCARRHAHNADDPQRRRHRRELHRWRHPLCGHFRFRHAEQGRHGQRSSSAATTPMPAAPR